MKDQLVISRGGQVLGTLATAEVIELVHLGFFRPDDWFQCEGMTERRLLAELPALANFPVNALDSTSRSSPTPVTEPVPEAPSAVPGSAPRSSWLARARQSVTNVAGTVAASAGDVAGRLHSFVGETPSAVTRATNAALEGYLPQILAALQKAGSAAATANDRVRHVVTDGVRDEALMNKTFGAVYDCLPRPVCRFVSEERFIAFCFEHRNRLLPKTKNDPS